MIFDLWMRFVKWTVIAFAIVAFTVILQFVAWMIQPVPGGIYADYEINRYLKETYGAYTLTFRGVTWERRYIYSVSLENSREFEVWLEYNELKIVDSYKGEKLTNKIRSDLENGLKLNDQIEIPAPTAGCSFPINDYGKICSGIFFDGISSKNPDMECSKECFSDTVYEICKNIKNEYNITSLTAVYRLKNGSTQELNVMLTYLPNFDEKIITVVIKLSPRVIYNIRTKEQL